ESPAARSARADPNGSLLRSLVSPERLVGLAALEIRGDRVATCLGPLAELLVGAVGGDLVVVLDRLRPLALLLEGEPAARERAVAHGVLTRRLDGGLEGLVRGSVVLEAELSLAEEQEGLAARGVLRALRRTARERHRLLEGAAPEGALRQ